MIVSYAQNAEDVRLWRVLQDVPSGFYVDVGAGDPTLDSVTRLFYERGWRGIDIEPLPAHAADLARERPRDVVVRAAAGAELGEVCFWDFPTRGWGTANPVVAGFHAEHGAPGTPLRVPVVTLDDVLEKSGPRDIHFLKIDVEGFEHEVLRGVDLTRHRPWIVVVEATFPTLQEDTSAAWEPRLADAGYLRVCFDGVNLFFVARERAELASRLEVPPNFFDHYVRRTEQDAELRRDLAEGRAAEAEARARSAEARVAEAQSRAQSMEARAQSGEARAAEAEARAAEAQARAQGAEARASEAQARTSEAQARTSEAQARAQGAEARASEEQARAQGAEARASEEQARAQEAEARRSAAEAHAQEAVAQFQAAESFALEMEAHARDADARTAAAEERIARRRARILSRLARSARSALRRLFPRRAPDPPQPTRSLREPAVPALTLPEARSGGRRRLAWLSPLPPQPSGIADFSADLLAVLGSFYDVDAIVPDPGEVAPLPDFPGQIRSVGWFGAHARGYDRIVYHLGNSPFHHHMFDLLITHPGVVVLHDFYLSDALRYVEQQGPHRHAWTRALFASHGYAAVAARHRAADLAEICARYPANLGALEAARGVIVHSHHAGQLAREWYGDAGSASFQQIPLLRAPVAGDERGAARRRLDLPQDAFVVCSFGLVSPNKLHGALIEAWSASTLAHDPACVLVLVGDAGQEDYRTLIWTQIRRSPNAARIRMTGRVEAEVYRDYLAAADLAVQLRTQSRGETSAAVLDCMNHGIPTIVNRHGSLVELPGDAVWFLPDTVTQGLLVESLERLRGDETARAYLAQRARQHVQIVHAPERCAEGYRRAIEEMYEGPRAEAPGPARTLRQLLVDVSAIAREDLGTGIQRVVRALVHELIQATPAGWRVEPVVLSDGGGRWHYRYARGWTCQQLGVTGAGLADDPLETSAGDLLLIADFTGGMLVEAERGGLYSVLKAAGVDVCCVVYDLLPLQMPQHFPPDGFGFASWLEAASRIADVLVGISRQVAHDVRGWLEQHVPDTRRPRVEWFHLGTDLLRPQPTMGLPADAEHHLQALRRAPTFLMVGTIEPRKGHLQALEAFTLLWRDGRDVQLAIVGREGWKGMSEPNRRTVLRIVHALRGHHELGRRLIWIEGPTDDVLHEIYGSSACVLAASEGEGFGLPLVEAAIYGLPILARRLPVFEEVAQGHATFFEGMEAASLAAAVDAWLAAHEAGTAKGSAGMPVRTWRQSAEMLVQAIVPDARQSPVS